MANLLKICAVGIVGITGLFGAGNLDAATYYVRVSGSDANAGQSAATAFQTIDRAAQVVTNGDIVYVGSGAYPDPILVLGVKQNSSAVRFVADLTGSVTGDAGSVLISGTTLRVAGSNGVQFEGFTFYGGSSHPVIWQDSFDGQLIGCVFPGGEKSLLVRSGSLTIDNCQFTDFANDAIQVDGAAQLLVRGSTVTGAAGRGIDIRKMADVSIDSTTITNCTGDGVHVELTNDVIPVDDIAMANCECSGGTSPQDLKQQAYEILQAMNPADVGYRQLISNLSQDVHGTLQAQLWTDDWHLKVADGPGVFETSTEVLRQLNDIYTDEVDFDIIGDELSVSHPYVAKITVLGAAISYGSYYDAPVTVRIKIGSHTYEPFGSYTSPTQGSVNDGQNPRVFEPTDTFTASDSISIAGRSWLKYSTGYSGAYDSHWYTYLEVTAATRPDNLHVLRNGDDVPNLQGVNGQNAVASFLTAYIEDGKIKLNANQAIVLFELGTTNMSSTAADFQDLVTLIGLRRSITPLTAAELAQIKQAMDLLLEADRTLAQCAIVEGDCGGGDTTDLVNAVAHFNDGVNNAAGEHHANASQDFQQAWEDAKQATGNQDVDTATVIANKSQPAPPAGWVAITSPRLVVSGATLTGNANGLWIATAQDFESRYTDYSNNAAWGLRLRGAGQIEHVTMDGNGEGGLRLDQTAMTNLTVDDLTLTNNAQFGLYADQCDLAFDSTNIGDYTISGSPIAVAATASDVTLQSVTLSGGSTAAVQLTNSTLSAVQATFSGSGYGLAIDNCNVSLTNCTFSGNSVGLFATRSDLLDVAGSTFSSSSLWGASITPSGTTGETATFRGCTFANNAGGLTLVSATDGDVMLRNATEIRDNSAAGLHFENCNMTVSDQAGGVNWSITRNLYGISCNQSTLLLTGLAIPASTSYGVFCEDSAVTLNACSVTGTFGVYASENNDSLDIERSVLNAGATPGWGVVRFGGQLSVTNSTLDGFWLAVFLQSSDGSDQATLLNNTIAHTTGYGVYMQNGVAVIRNTILTGEGIGYGLVRVGGTTTHTHNLLHGFSTPYFGLSADASEVSKNPRFVDAAQGNFHLGVGSPAINAGLDLVSLVSTDLEGNARPSFNGFEIGAYEYMDPNGSFRVLDWAEKR